MRHFTVVPILAVLAVACSSDPAGPSEQPPPPPPAEPTWIVRLEASNISVVEMCDGFPVDVNGGEWTHELTVRFPGETSIVMGGTSGYPNAGAHRNIGRGGAMALNSGQRIQERTKKFSEGNQVIMTLRATEWDFDILGNNPFPDSRMNNRTTSASFTYSDGEWTQVPSGTLTVKNGASCEVRVSFKFEAVKQ
jgi:hypothetical protein